MTQTIKLESSGRMIYLDDCDHDPEIISKEEKPDEYTIRKTYHWNCTKCHKTVAPYIFAEHPCGFITRF